MDSEIKSRWVAALQSGEYEQGQNDLRGRAGDWFCCLGVLCDLYAQDKGIQNAWDDAEASGLAQIDAALPSKNVVEWAGLEDSDPVIVVAGCERTCSGHNDDARRTFAQIAAAIEAQL